MLKSAMSLIPIPLGAVTLKSLVDDPGTISMSFNSGLSSGSPYVNNSLQATGAKTIIAILATPVYAIGSLLNDLSGIILGIVDAVVDGVRDLIAGLVTLKPVMGIACAIRAITSESFCLNCVCN
jgi:hypothetical protein